MAHDDEDGKYAYGRLPDRTYITARFASDKNKRFAIRVWDANSQPRFGWISSKQEFAAEPIPQTVVVREEECIQPEGKPYARYQLKIIFLETSRDIQEIVLQKFTKKSGKPHKDVHISLSLEQATQLIKFFNAVRVIPLDDGEKERIDNAAVDRLLLDEGSRRQFLNRHPEIESLLREGLGREIECDRVWRQERGVRAISGACRRDRSDPGHGSAGHDGDW